MKDYSKFIQNSYGFITKYEIVGDEIRIYTAESEKGEPHKYPANKEWIKYVEDRLENQYRLLVDNKNIFKEEFVEKKCYKIYLVTSILGSILLLASVILLLLGQSLLSISFAVSLMAMFFGNTAIVSKMNKDFDKEIEVIEAYLNNREKIENISKKDRNITDYLSSKTTKRIKENKALSDCQVLDSTFNIDFMDKTSLKDLKKMLNRYFISMGMESEQTFVAPVDRIKKKNSSKKRKLKKK